MVLRTRLDDKEEFMRGSDYKYEIQMLAEEAAQEKYDKDFYALTDAEQIKLYAEAEEQYQDQRAAYFESMVDAAQDR
jgi:hypothetical protein